MDNPKMVLVVVAGIVVAGGVMNGICLKLLMEMHQKSNDKQAEMHQKSSEKQAETYQRIQQGFVDALRQRDEAEMVREERASQWMGQISAQYLNRVIIRRYIGRDAERSFVDQLRHFVRLAVVPDGGPTATQPVRPELQASYARLREHLAFSPKNVLLHLRDLGHLAHAFNAPHHEVMDALHCPPGFYVGGRQFTNELAAIVGLLCVALQRDPADGFPACVHLLGRSSTMCVSIRDAMVT